MRYFLVLTVTVFSFFSHAEVVQIENSRGSSTWVHTVGPEEGDIGLVVIQPYLTNYDFQTPAQFEAALYSYLELAESQGMLNEMSVVVFPELLGLYLYFTLEDESVYEATSIVGAGGTMVRARLLNPVRAVKFLGEAPFSLKGRPFDIGGLLFRKLLNGKAPVVAQVYQTTFSSLARRFGVTIVAGSVPLPSPYVSDEGELLVNKRGDMENVSAVFYPWGEMDPQLTVKTHPTSYEEKDLFTPKRSVHNLPTYRLPFGRLGVAICADSWYPAVYDHFERQGVDFLAVPSYLAGAQSAEVPWGGYNHAEGIQPPQDIDGRDIGWLTEWEAWEKYAMPGRIQRTSFRGGATSFMKGNLWGEAFTGAPMLSSPAGTYIYPIDTERGSIVRHRIMGQP